VTDLPIFVDPKEDPPREQEIRGPLRPSRRCANGWGHRGPDFMTGTPGSDREVKNKLHLLRKAGLRYGKG
jgi:hypothetical protein